MFLVRGVALGHVHSLQMAMHICRSLIAVFSHSIKISSRAMSNRVGRVLPDGVYPTMITPFLDDERKTVDWNCLDILTEWYINSGVAGIFSICLSSEMFQLSNEERVAIAKHVVDKTAGRVPVVVGATFEGGLEEQARLMNEMGRFADSVVIITNQIASMDDSDDVWMKNCQRLMDLTGDLPLGLYETPIPKTRNLTPEMLKWVAQSGRFTFHKDTCLQLDRMIEKIEAVKAVPGTPLKFFTAKIQFVNTCLDNGGNGFSGITGNFFPWVPAWLCEHKQDSEEKRKKVQTFLSVSDRVISHKYPTSAKVFLSKYYGVPIAPVSRIHTVTFNDQDLLALENLKTMMEETCKDVEMTPVHPMKSS